MKKLSLLTLSIATAMVLAVGGGSAVATEHNQRSCEAAGGVWTNTNGTKACVIAEEGKNDNFSCETTTAGQGNLGNKTKGPTEEEQNTGSGKCPPGQYPG